jgi:anti-sigma factor RsiW
MTPEQARALFDTSLDGELSEGQQRALDRALAGDATLREDFARYQEVRRATAELSRMPEQVDLLAGVQHKLRARSGGKFYRDRFSQRAGQRSANGIKVLIVLSALLVLSVLLWFAFDTGLLLQPR